MHRFFFLIIKNIYASRYFRNSLGNQVACGELNLNFIKIYAHYSTRYLQKHPKSCSNLINNRTKCPKAYVVAILLATKTCLGAQKPCNIQKKTISNEL